MSVYNVDWDTEINGILLIDDEGITPPRPVFYEELDLLGFDKNWSYPKVKNPLLWAIGRRYYYKGDLVATAKKGGALKLPTLVFEEGYENLELEEIDIEEVIRRNSKQLSVLENKVFDFIDEISNKYPGNPFSVSFSGGKDSQSVLDLITRVIDSDEITIIFSDTTLEHDFTYSTIDESIKYYKEKCPGLKFNIAKPVKSASELFKDMGLPSRIHRWCTPALKTAPYNKLINELVDPKSKIIVFEGVRAEESAKRSKYKQIADGVKHPSIINARPILYWNFSEVVLYNFYRELPMNPLYRYGLTRVGCELCPFSSDWSDCINSQISNKFKTEYVPLIKEYAKNRGLSNEKDLDKFVFEGNWKKRAGGKGINCDSSTDFSESEIFELISTNPSENFLEWIKVLGDVSYNETNGKIKGELNIDGNYTSFLITTKENKQIIEFCNIQNDKILRSRLKKVLNKSTFCVHCGICDVECVEGAIKTYPNVQIDSNLCTHCGNCIKFVQYGCYRAKSVYAGSGGKSMKKRTSGIDRYSTFGLRQGWLEEFLDFGDSWLKENSLGPKQKPAVKNWLAEAGLIDSKTKKTTELGNNLKNIYKDDPYFVWGIIWINLYYNSKVITWYCDTFEWGIKISREELLETAMDSFPDLSEGTLKNPTSAMINMFDKTPLNDAFNLGILEKKGKATKFINKIGGVNDIDILLVAYSLYKVKENQTRTDFIVSELYDGKFEGGPNKLFGISQTQLERILRGLKQYPDEIVKVDLVGDLDNIFLNKDITCDDIIKLKKEGV